MLNATTNWRFSVPEALIQWNECNCIHLKGNSKPKFIRNQTPSVRSAGGVPFVDPDGGLKKMLICYRWASNENVETVIVKIISEIIQSCKLVHAAIKGEPNWRPWCQRCHDESSTGHISSNTSPLCYLLLLSIPLLVLFNHLVPYVTWPWWPTAPSFILLHGFVTLPSSWPIYLSDSKYWNLYATLSFCHDFFWTSQYLT